MYPHFLAAFFFLTQPFVACWILLEGIVEILYQFVWSDEIFANTLIIDVIRCAGVLPVVILGIISNGIVDRFWRTQQALELRLLADAKALVAGAVNVR